MGVKRASAAIPTESVQKKLQTSSRQLAAPPEASSKEKETVLEPLGNLLFA